MSKLREAVKLIEADAILVGDHDENKATLVAAVREAAALLREMLGAFDAFRDRWRMSKLRDVLARLDAIKLRAANATKGPWHVGGGSMKPWAERLVVRGPSGEYLARVDPQLGGIARVAFIAAARQDVPDLVEAVEDQRELLGRLAEAASRAHEAGNEGILCKPTCSICSAITEAEEALGR